VEPRANAGSSDLGEVEGKNVRSPFKKRKEYVKIDLDIRPLRLRPNRKKEIRNIPDLSGAGGFWIKNLGELSYYDVLSNRVVTLNSKNGDQGFLPLV